MKNTVHVQANTVRTADPTRAHQSLPTPFDATGVGSGGLRPRASWTFLSIESSLDSGEPPEGGACPLPPAPPAPRVPGFEAAPPSWRSSEGDECSAGSDGSPLPWSRFADRGDGRLLFEPGGVEPPDSGCSGGGLRRFAANSRLAAASNRTASRASPPRVVARQAS